MVEMIPRSSGKIESAVLGFIIHIEAMNIVKYIWMKSRLVFNDIDVMIGQNPRVFVLRAGNVSSDLYLK